MAYSIQAPGPHGPGYQLAGSPVSCRQLDADAGSVKISYHSVHRLIASLNIKSTHFKAATVSLQLYAMGLSNYLYIHPSVAKMSTKNPIFSKTKQFRAIVSINDL